MDQLGPLRDDVEAGLDELARIEAPRRLWARDHTLWGDDPEEVADRLGWLEVADDLAAETGHLDAFVLAARAAGITHAVVMGMGGSSLFPEVVARTTAAGDDVTDLRVLDTTDPAAVARIAHECPAGETLFIASSKSGTTLETRSQLAHFWDLIGRPGQFAAITDPGSELARLGRDRDFRAVFENRADIGGRYSALSHFGMVPASIAGADRDGMLARAREMARRCGPDVAPAESPGMRLGAILAAAVAAGRDKVTLVIDPEFDTFGLWLEQLLAESTGKAGTGVVPIAGERLGPAGVYGDDRLFVGIGSHPGLAALAEAGHPVTELGFTGVADLGAQVFCWEVATAVCGARLGINAFDQPDVAAAKAATDEVLAHGLDIVEETPLEALLSQVAAGDYLALQAYVDPEDGVVDAIEDARTALRDRLGVATTFGLGPRFLHSTGQLHKGGPATGVFIQLVGDDALDAEIPGADYGFATLKRAQADGDLRTLGERGRRAGRVRIDELLEVNR